MNPGSWRITSGGLLLKALLLSGTGFLVPGALAGQDTVTVADTLTRADSLTLPDSVLLLGDSVQVAEDTVQVIHALTALPGAPSTGSPGVVRWDREALVRNPALTLRELLSTLPGAIPLRTGDFGAPQGLVMNGMAGGRLRVFLDGVEEVAMDGSVPDLAHVSLGGIGSVELSTAGGETRIHLTSVQAEGPEPASTIEAGTGDLDTNLFRGSFVHPDAFNGGLGLFFERLDARGRRSREDGSLQGFQVRYLRPLGDRVTLSGELRGRTAETVLDRAPPSTGRSTMLLRMRARLATGMVGEVFAARTSHDLKEDSVVAESLRLRQFGARLGVESGAFRSRAAVRWLDGAVGAEPSLRGDVDAEVVSERVGGVAGRLGWDAGEGDSRMIQGVSAWTGSLLGFSLHGSWDQGERGWTPAMADALGRRPDSLVVAPPSGSDRTALRAGARFQGGPLTVEGAWLRTEVDSVLPLGNRVDLGTRAFPGDEATGWEVSGSLAMPIGGLALVGSLQQWEEEGLYRPERIYRGGITFNRLFYPTGNLEFNVGALVEGRDPMLLPILDETGTGPARVPFYQSWNVHLQIRVVTVRAFIRWENLSLRDNNQDLPGRLLPGTRVMYGVRWTLTN